MFRNLGTKLAINTGLGEAVMHLSQMENLRTFEALGFKCSELGVIAVLVPEVAATEIIVSLTSKIEFYRQQLVYLNSFLFYRHVHRLIV